MKTVKKILLAAAMLSFIGLAALFAWRPVLLKVLWYRVPDADTYKAFPQAVIKKSTAPFYFVRTGSLRNDLDTLHVLDGTDRSVTLLNYLKNGRVKAFMVIRNDTVLYEKYGSNYSDSTLTTVFSMAKSMVSIAAGKALADGKITSLDDKVTKYLPELAANPAFEGVNIEHLLSMKSGLAFKDTGGGFVDALFSDEARYYYTNDMKAALMTVKRANAPGTVWKYKSIDAILLGWIVERATGKTLSEYFEKEIWQKIGAAYAASWGLDMHRMANTASRFQATAIDLAKVGKLFLQKGKFNGVQVLPENWVMKSTVAGPGKPSSAKGWQRSAHNYLWWVPQQGERGDYAAEGMLGQRLYADPVTNTIIVVLADKGAGNYPYRKISRFLAGMKFNYPSM